MCTYNITVNDALIERARPAIGADTDISQWMQRQMEALLIRLAVTPQRETKQYAPDLEAILAIPRHNHFDVPDVVLSLLGAGETVADHDLNAREAYHQYLMQYYTALHANAEAIITRNGKDFKASRIPVMTASEYLSTIVFD